MTHKQRRFVEEYLTDLDAANAAIRAGFKPAESDALLLNPEISGAIKKALAQRSKRTGVNSDRIIYELAKIAFLDPADITNPEDLSREDIAALAALKLKKSEGGEIIESSFKTFDKLRALELLGKYLGIWDGKAGGEHTSAVDDWIRAMTEVENGQA